MFSAVSLLIILVLPLGIVAIPVEVRTTRATLPFAERINASDGGAIKLVEHDQARAAALKEHGAALAGGKLDRRAGSIEVTNEAFSYLAAVGVSDPATTDRLIVDARSSSARVGADAPCAQITTNFDASAPVSVTYDSIVPSIRPAPTQVATHHRFSKGRKALRSEAIPKEMTITEFL